MLLSQSKLAKLKTFNKCNYEIVSAAYAGESADGGTTGGVRSFL